MPRPLSGGGKGRKQPLRYIKMVDGRILNLFRLRFVASLQSIIHCPSNCESYELRAIVQIRAVQIHELHAIVHRPNPSRPNPRAIV